MLGAPKENGAPPEGDAPSWLARVCENLVLDLGPERNGARLRLHVASVEQNAGLPLQAEGGQRHGFGQHGPYLKSNGGVFAIKLVDGDRGARGNRSAQALDTVVQLALQVHVSLVVLSNRSVVSLAAAADVEHSPRQRHVEALDEAGLVGELHLHVGGNGLHTRYDEISHERTVRSQGDRGVAARLPIHRLVVGAGVGIVGLTGHLDIGSRGKLDVAKGGGQLGRDAGVVGTRRITHDIVYFGVLLVFEPLHERNVEPRRTDLHAQVGADRVAALVVRVVGLFGGNAHGEIEIRAVIAERDAVALVDFPTNVLAVIVTDSVMVAVFVVLNVGDQVGLVAGLGEDSQEQRAVLEGGHDVGSHDVQVSPCRLRGGRRRLVGEELFRIFFVAVDDDLEVLQLDGAVPAGHHFAGIHRRLLRDELNPDVGAGLVLESKHLIVDVVARGGSSLTGDGEIRSDCHLPIQAGRARGK